MASWYQSGGLVLLYWVHSCFQLDCFGKFIDEEHKVEFVTSMTGLHGRASRTPYTGRLQSLLESSSGLVSSASFYLASTTSLMLSYHCKYGDAFYLSVKCKSS